MFLPSGILASAGGFPKAGLVLHHSAHRSPQTIDVSDGVEASTGLSGTSIALAQTVAGNRPLLVSGAQNDRDVWRFDGVDDFLVLSAAPISGTTARTLLMTINCRTVQGSGNDVPFTTGLDAAGQRWTARVWDNGAVNTLRFDMSGFGYTSSLVVPTNTWCTIGATMSGGTTLADNTLILNSDTEAATGTNEINTTSGDERIGTLNDAVFSDAFDGDIGEIMFWDRALSATELSQAIAYLNGWL